MICRGIYRSDDFILGRGLEAVEFGVWLRGPPPSLKFLDILLHKMDKKNFSAI